MRLLQPGDVAAVGGAAALSAEVDEGGVKKKWTQTFITDGGGCTHFGILASGEVVVVDDG